MARQDEEDLIEELDAENEDYNEFLDIDLLNLEVECQHQPKRFKKWSDILADAKRDHSQADADLDLVKAELDLEIRDDPNRYGLGKVTASAMAAAIKTRLPTMKRYKRALRRLINAKHRVDVLEGTVKALDDRKKQLGHLVQLHGQQYFAAPLVKDERARAELDRHRKKRIRSAGQEKRHRRP